MRIALRLMPMGTGVDERDRGAAAKRARRARRAILRYERHHEPLLTPRDFLHRMLRHGGLTVVVLALSLGGGALGYRVTEGMSWLDAFLNASMILTGMGPVSTLVTDAGKLFATGYAIFSGVVFLAAVGFLLAPVFHRFLHRFHLAEDDDS